LLQAAAQNRPEALLKVIPQKDVNKIAPLGEPSPIEVTVRDAFAKLSKK